MPPTGISNDNDNNSNNNTTTTTTTTTTSQCRWEADGIWKGETLMMIIIIMII